MVVSFENPGFLRVLESPGILLWYFPGQTGKSWKKATGPGKSWKKATGPGKFWKSV